MSSRRTLYRGADRVLCPSPAAPGSAVAVLDDRIVAVGPEAQCAAALGEGHQVVDLTGSVLAPGLIDAHLHPLIMSVFEAQLPLERCRSFAELFDVLADGVREGSGTIAGFQLDAARLAEGRLPTAVELDAVVGDRAAVLVCRDGHHAVGSSAALRNCGLWDLAEIDGGHIGRGADGRPNGLVGERAVEVLLNLLPEVTMESLSSGMAVWSQRLLSQGITGITAFCQTTEDGPSGSAGSLEAVAWSVLCESLPFDIQTVLITPNAAEVEEFRTTPLHRPELARRLDGVKLFLDGTLGGRTACMHRGFSDDPAVVSGEVGVWRTEPEAAFQRIEAAHVAGLQICIHAIGDRANQQAAALLGRVIRRHPGPHRHRVEHASVLDDSTIQLFGELGITAVVQPINLRTEAHWLAQRVGTERLGNTYPFRSLVSAGVVLAGSSDAPIEPSDPFAAMAAAVHRGGLADEQQLSPAEAFALYTSGAAYARQSEGRTGAIQPAHRADLTVLSADPTQCLATDVKVLATIAGGVEVFRAS